MADGPVVFSLVRLGPPAFAEQPQGFKEQDLLHDAQRSSMPASAATFASRLQGDTAGAGGFLTLPKLGPTPVYLGQSFSCLITASNYGGATLTLLGIKVELSTESRRVSLLYDSTGSPLPALAAGGGHEFGVRADIKELGGHTLTCTASYTGGDGDWRQQAQAFTFSALNPLVVRTKQRQVGEATLLEATLENATAAPMLLEAVTFFPGPSFSAERIPQHTAGRATLGPGEGPLSSYIQSLPLIPEGGSSAVLFRLTRVPAPAPAAPAAAADASGTLGRMEIKWSGPRGEVARLQTQLISLPPQVPRELSLEVAQLPQRVAVGAPFTLTLLVRSHVDRRMGPLKIAAAAAGAASPAGSPARGVSSSSSGEPHTPRMPGASSLGTALGAAVCLDGPQDAFVAELAPRQVAEVRLQLLAMVGGQQALPAFSIASERDGKQYAVLAPVELFVESCAA